MAEKQRSWDLRSLVLGLGAGAGTALLASSILNRNPEKRPSQLLVNRALDQRLHTAREETPIRLQAEHRYVIFSDHHKGARTLADPFTQCESSYLSALEYYFKNDFTLILLGDAEELLEEGIEQVLSAYPQVLRSEARFHPDRLIRVYGNHDIYWKVDEIVEKFLDPFFPALEYRQEVLFEYLDGDRTSGEIFLIHGYQGTIESDIFSFMAEWVLPSYRNFQIRTGFGATTSPSRDACLRSQHDNRLYRWVSKKSKLILICGHTHRPVWSSKTHLDKLSNQLHSLLQLDPEEQSADHAEQVQALMQEIQKRQEEQPPCDDIVKTRPAYFNTGCCQFADGDITGLEIENGMLRLIKWGLDEGDMTRKILEQNPLAEIFFYL